MSSNLQALALKIAELERRLDAHAQTPQLASSSIEDGAVQEYDVDGRLMSQYGQQFDGTSGAAVLNGPIPPRPTPAVVTPAIGGLLVEWDGYFANAPGALDLSTATSRFLTNLALTPNQFMQYVYKDPNTGDFYASMNLPGTQSGRETVLVSHCAPDGSLLDSMTLTDAGHGNNLNFERIGSDIHIWVNWQEALVAGQGNQLVRVQYRPGATLTRAETSYFTTVNKFAPGATNTDIAIDFANDWVAQRVSTDAGTTDTYRRRRWSEMLAGVDKVYNSIGPIALLPPTMQGMATIGDDLYWYSGTGPTSATEPRLLQRVSWITGQVTATINTDSLGQLPDGSFPGAYHEPEGLSVYTDPATGAVSLLAGLVTGNSSTIRKQQVFAFSASMSGDPTIAAPLDFSRIEIHAKAATSFVANSAATLQDTIETPRGASRFIMLPDGDYSVVLVARSLPGLASMQSDYGTGTPRKITAADVLGGNLGGAHVFKGSTPPTGMVEGDLWYKADTSGSYTIWQYDNGTWTQRVSSSDQISADIHGKTITGGTIQTDSSGSRVVLDDQGGLVAYASDGTKNVAIFNKGELNNPTGDVSGIWLGKNVGLRFEGRTGSLNASIGKSVAADGTEGDSLRFRAAENIDNGAGISLYDKALNPASPTADGDGDPYAGSTRFFSNGNQVLKLLQNDDAVFRGTLRASQMRPVTAIGGVSTLRSVNTFAVIDSGPFLTFVAPSSGMVKIHLTGYLRASTAGAQAQMGIEVREGTAAGGGTLIASPSGFLVNGNTGWIRTGGTLLVAGMRPGYTHYVRPMFRSDTNAADVYASEAALVVSPCF